MGRYSLPSGMRSVGRLGRMVVRSSNQKPLPTPSMKPVKTEQVFQKIFGRKWLTSAQKNAIMKAAAHPERGSTAIERKALKAIHDRASLKKSNDIKKVYQGELELTEELGLQRKFNTRSFKGQAEYGSKELIEENTPPPPPAVDPIQERRRALRRIQDQAHAPYMYQTSQSTTPTIQEPTPLNSGWSHTADHAAGSRDAAPNTPGAPSHRSMGAPLIYGQRTKPELGTSVDDDDDKLPNVVVREFDDNESAPKRAPTLEGDLAFKGGSQLGRQLAAARDTSRLPYNVAPAPGVSQEDTVSTPPVAPPLPPQTAEPETKVHDLPI